MIFGVGVLLTGSIWAHASWGKWWVWDEPTLVSFLIVFLLYATYYPLRYAIEDRDRQARYASVFAITAGAFVPLNFIAVRMAQSLVHPRVFATTTGGLPGSMLFTFLVCLAGMALLWTCLVRFELAAKSASARLSRLRRALEGETYAAPTGIADRARRPLPRHVSPHLMPALPLDEAGRYVAAAYVVFVALLLVYVAIMAAKLPADRPRARRPRRPRRATGCAPRPRGGAPVTELLALGISHKTAPLELRERVALTEGRAAGGAARAGRRTRGPRGRRDLDLQPDRALPRRPGPGGRGIARPRGARPRGRHAAHRAGRPPLFAPRRRGRDPRCSRSPPGSTR